MPTVSFEVSDVARYKNALATYFEYDTKAEDGETKAEFAQRVVAEYLEGIVKKVEADQRNDDLAVHLQTEEAAWEVANPEPGEVTVE